MFMGEVSHSIARVASNCNLQRKPKVKTKIEGYEHRGYCFFQWGEDIRSLFLTLYLLN